MRDGRTSSRLDYVRLLGFCGWPLHLGELAVEESDLAHRRVDGVALGARQLLLGPPGQTLDAEQADASAWPFRERINTAGSRPPPAAGADELRATREPAAHRADTLIRSTHASSSPPRKRCPGHRGDRSWPEPGGPSIAARDNDHPRNVRLDDPGYRPSVARHVQRDRVARHKLWVNSSQRLGRVWTRPADREAPSATIATRNSRVHMQRNCSTSASHLRQRRRRR
jgi:hypothetical protein